MLCLLGVICMGCLVQICLAQSGALRGPPQVEKNPKFAGSYIPAAMQIIAHDTELMKYVIKPPEGTTTTTTTTMRPTPPHGPGIFAPSSRHSIRGNIRDQYVQVQQQPSGLNYFDRYYNLLSPEEQKSRTLQKGNDIYEEAEKYLGKGFGDVLRLANRIDEDDDRLKDEESQVSEFFKVFEDKDSSYRFEILRQKRVPPTKAYVTLLSLYDMLSKESKRLMLNKYSGYTDEVLRNLTEFSRYTSSHQLKSTLNKVLENGDTRNADVVSKIKMIIDDLNVQGGYLNDALRDIPPLAFAP